MTPALRSPLAGVPATDGVLSAAGCGAGRVLCGGLAELAVLRLTAGDAAPFFHTNIAHHHKKSLTNDKYCDKM